MRLRSIYSVTIALALTGLSFSNMARNATPRYAEYYEGCYCYFGYVGGDKECVPATACVTEGGTCRGSCRAKSDKD
jgi:hypothetical protein